MKCIKEKCRYFGNHKFWGKKTNNIWSCGLTLHAITEIDDECYIDNKIENVKNELYNLESYKDFISKN